MSETATLRCFYALPVPTAARPALLAAQSRLRTASEGSPLRPRFSVEAQLHVTLKFLGDVPREAIPDFMRLATERAAALAPIEAFWARSIAFGGPRRARAIVAALEDVGGALTRLAESLETAVLTLGVPRETRRYRPHVTLARLRQPGDVRLWLAQATPESVRMVFDELRLYASERTPDGGVYTVLESVRFGG